MTKLNKNSTAHETYNIQYWSDGFFCIDQDGYVVLKSKDKDNDYKFRLTSIVDQCISSHPDLSLPLLLRFPSIIHQRLDGLLSAFNKAFEKNGYTGNYLPAYPIKVNQEKSVLDSFLEHDFKIALEAGSKPELFAVIALGVKNNLDIICNGYKDKDYIKLALLGQKLGLNVNIIVEKLSELDLVLDISQELDVIPRLGVRVRLGSLGKGNWQNTGGVKSKFGLTSVQLLAFIEKLKNANKLDCLKVLHFHMGSQISDLEDIQNGLREGCRLYAEINHSGAKLEAIDVGGGLGVDYEGTCSRSYYSINYNIESYADTIVKTIKEICDSENLKHPKIITESGRAMVAHHAVLVTNIIDVEPVLPENISNKIDYKNIDFITSLEDCYNDLRLDPRKALEIYHQSHRYYDTAQSLYIQGDIDLSVRACAEEWHYKICFELLKVLNPKIKNHQVILDNLNEEMANKIFCNFSLFQSLPDIWGLSQIFPILPLSDLNKLDDDSQSMRGLIQDITCDSDGRIDKYIDGQGVENSLPMPIYDKNNPYHIGFFMVGAYQEILGDLHNLFGNTSTVDVIIKDKNYNFVNLKQGDSTLDVLKYVDFDGRELLSSISEKYKDIETSSDKQGSVIKFLEKYLSNNPYFD